MMLTRIISTVQILLVLAARGLADCPDGYEGHLDFCYKLLPVKASWAEAMHYCEAAGGDLAVIRDDTENNFVKGLLTRYQGKEDREKMMTNTTQLADVNVANNATEESFIPVFVGVASICALAIALITTLVLTAALITLQKCTKLSYQIKRLSYNTLLSDIAFHMLLVISVVYVFIWGEDYKVTAYYPRIIAVATLHLTSQASVAGLTLDRTVAVLKPLSYNGIMTKKVVKLMTAFIWLIHAVVPITFTISTWYVCNWNLTTTDCDLWTALLPARVVIAAFYLAYNVYIAFSYISISRNLLNQSIAITVSCISHSEQNPALERENKNLTRNIIRIVLTFEICNIPIFINVLVLVFVPINVQGQFHYVIHMLGYICMCCNSYISMHFYVWRMTECKLVFLNTFFSWSDRCKRIADDIKRELHGVP